MRYVTRTITQTVVATQSVDNESMEIMPFHFILGNIKDEKKIERETRKGLAKLGFTLVKIEGITREDVKYRMTEAEFIRNAEVVE